MTNRKLHIAYTAEERSQAEAEARAEGRPQPTWGTHRTLYFNAPTGLQRCTSAEGHQPTPTDLTHGWDAERKRRRKRARRLGHPPPKGHTMLLDDETVDQATLLLEGRAGWGHPNFDELDRTPSELGMLACAPEVAP